MDKHVCIISIAAVLGLISFVLFGIYATNCDGLDEEDCKNYFIVAMVFFFLLLVTSSCCLFV